MKKIVVVSAVVIVVLAALGAGLWFTQQIRQREALKNVIVSIAEIHVEEIGLTGATLNIRLRMQNPNSLTATLDRMDYTIYGNGNNLGSGNIAQRTDIPAGGENVASTDFDLLYSGAAKVIQSDLATGNVKWRITGTAYFDTPIGTINVPFDVQQSSP